MDTLKMHSPDLTQRNIARLAELFPNVVTEQLDDDGSPIRAVDFDLLRQELTDHVVEGSRERYQLDWPGKRAALFAASAPIAKTLRPVREASLAYDTTRNLFIEGDNLDSLKLLQDSYLNQVRLIYIDPPYNSGSDRFVYEDDFASSNEEYLQHSGQSGSAGVRFVSNPETNGRFHSDWLSMMYPRLRLARRLLTPDGVILISIDDREQANLRLLMDEVFGGQNFLAQLIWDKQHSQQQGIFKRYHEFVLAYARDASVVDYIRGGDGVIEAGALKKVSKANPASEFQFPAGVRFDAPDGTIIEDAFGEAERVEVVAGRLVAENGRTGEPVTLRAGWTQKNQMISWFAGEETIDTRGQRVLEFFFSSTGKLKCLKERGRITPSTFLPKYGMNSEHTRRLATLMGGSVFDNPKPVGMLEDFVEWFTEDGDLVLDFFAGSGTTAEAVMRVAAKSGTRRHFILAQLDETCPPETPAHAAGYQTIAELARDRVRRAGAEILQQPKNSPNWDGDVGFRALRVDTTNRRDTAKVADDVVQVELIELADNLKADRTDEDLLFQVMLDWGLDLRLPIALLHLGDAVVYEVAEGSLLAAFGEKLGSDTIRAMAQRSPLRAVFRDAGFATDADRINAEQIFAELSPATDVKVI